MIVFCITIIHGGREEFKENFGPTGDWNRARTPLYVIRYPKQVSDGSSRGTIVMVLAHRARQDQRLSGGRVNVSPAFICHSSVCDPLPETSFGRIIMAAAVVEGLTFPRPSSATGSGRENASGLFGYHWKLRKNNE